METKYRIVDGEVKSMEFVEWIVWTVFAAVTLLMYIVWRWKRVKYRSGEYCDADIVGTLYTLPRAVNLIWGILA
jgi:hypothetical protein